MGRSSIKAIFDAISIATAYALGKNKNIEIKDLKKRRRKLLEDEKFIHYIAERTTNVENIRGRIGIALKKLYGMNYE